MQAVFQKYKELFESRYNIKSVLEMGEDSIRYDFFLALMAEKKLNSWEVHMEHPMSAECYVATENAKRKRKEKPQIDLYTNTDRAKVCAEFGFFRRNSNDQGTIARTENTFKMLNDFMRLGIQSKITESMCYFVCVADSKMLGHQLYNNRIPEFPAIRYEFTAESLRNAMDGYLSSDKVAARFLNKLDQLDITIAANLIFNEKLISEINAFETRILIWEVTVK